MGSADAAFVTAAPQLVVFWGFLHLFLPLSLSCELQVTSRSQWLLSAGDAVSVSDQGQEEFGQTDGMYVRLRARALCDNCRSKGIGY